MIQGLKLLNLPSGIVTKEQLVGDVFILKTCQRTMILGYNLVPFFYVQDGADFETYSENDAYIYLLETICGLKSKVLAENEITGQFKTAYLDYLKLQEKNSHIMNLLEKLFMDAKDIRTNYLYALGQQSYAGLSRRFLQTKKESGKVLIVGSGQLAKDLIKLLDKRYELFITARNEQKIKDVFKQYPDKTLKTSQWKDYSAWETFDLIVNTIGTETILFNENFFTNWKSSGGEVFVDLGSPSVLDTSLTARHGVYRLADVFEHGSTLNKEKEIKVSHAKKAIENLADKRMTSFSLTFPFGWEELHFA